jgi:hypothetical protein
MKKSRYWEQVKDFFLVFEWSKRWNRYICVSKFDTQEDAELATKEKKIKKGPPK